MSDSTIMSQHERTAKHKQAHPEGEAVRKQRQRKREELMRFHIKRNHLYGYGIPEMIDQQSDLFQRVRDQYNETLSEGVEVVEVCG